MRSAVGYNPRQGPAPADPLSATDDYRVPRLAERGAHACSAEFDFSIEIRNDSDADAGSRCFHVRTRKRRANAHHRERVA
jgi:hypothetical protein